MIRFIILLSILLSVIFSLSIFALLPEQNKTSQTLKTSQNGPYHKPNYVVNMFNMQVYDVKRREGQKVLSFCHLPFGHLLMKHSIF